MKKIAYLSFCILVTVLITGNADAVLKILNGEHTVVYDIVNPRGVAFIPNYTDESFEQRVVTLDEYSKRVTVTSKMGPLKSRVPFPIRAESLSPAVARYLLPEPERQSDDPSIVQLAKQITKGSEYAHEAVNSILSWIADNLTFDTTYTVPVDAVSALRYRRAYCQGYSNLAVSLLRAAGIPARSAHGYLPPGYEWGVSKEYWGVKVNDGGYHRYLEIYYPDTGWAFSDPEHSFNFVDPFHILLSIDGVKMPGAYRGGFLEVEKATMYTIFKEENKTMMVDELPLPKEKRLGRRIDDNQHTALVTGTVNGKNGIPVLKGTAVLWKDGRGTPYPFADGRYAIPLSNSGTYRVELKGPGFAKSSRDIVAVRGEVYRLNFMLQPGGVIKGKVVDSRGKPVSDGDVFYREGNASFGVSIESDGTYRIEGLAPGQYAVSVMTGDKKVTHVGHAEAGRQTTLDFVVK